MPSPRSSPVIRPTSPLSPRFENPSGPRFDHQPQSSRSLHVHTTQHTTPRQLPQSQSLRRHHALSTLKLPALPRFHPANFPSAHSSVANTPASGYGHENPLSPLTPVTPSSPLSTTSATPHSPLSPHSNSSNHHHQQYQYHAQQPNSQYAPHNHNHHHHPQHHLQQQLQAQQKVYSDAQKQLFLYQRDILAGRAAAAVVGLQSKNPVSPKLAPLGSPGPVTPLELENGSEDYMAAGTARALRAMSSSSSLMVESDDEGSSERS